MLPKFDPTVYDEIYDPRVAELRKRMRAERLLEQADRDYGLRKRAAIAKTLEAYTQLSVAGKAEFIRQVNRLNDSDYAVRRAAWEKMFETLNDMKRRYPKHHDCPCCGFRSTIDE